MGFKSRCCLWFSFHPVGFTPRASLEPINRKNPFVESRRKSPVQSRGRRRAFSCTECRVLWLTERNNGNTLPPFPSRRCLHTHTHTHDVTLFFHFIHYSFVNNTILRVHNNNSGSGRSSLNTMLLLVFFSRFVFAYKPLRQKEKNEKERKKKCARFTNKMYFLTHRTLCMCV